MPEKFVEINDDVTIQFDSPETLQINAFENAGSGCYIYLDFDEVKKVFTEWFQRLPSSRQREVMEIFPGGLRQERVEQRDDLR